MDGARAQPVTIATAGVPQACRVCGTMLAGPYCQACGQPSVAVRRTPREVLTGQTGRLAHTLRLILTAPGELAREVDEARDRPSLRPLTLRFHLAALFFLVSTFTGFGVAAIEQADSGGSMATRIDRHAAESHAGSALYRERLEHRFQAIYTVFVPLIALSYGGVIGLLHWRRKPWLVPIARGIQYLCFIYLLLGVVWTLARAAGLNPFGLSPGQVVVLLFGLAYATLTHRRIYPERWMPAVLKGAVVVVVGAAVHNFMLIAALVLAVLVT